MRITTWLLWMLVMGVGVPAYGAPGAVYLHAKDIVKLDDTGQGKLVAPSSALTMELAVDRDGDVWLGSVAGKITAYKAKRRAVQLPIKDRTARYPVAMTAAKDGGIWALGREHLFRITAAGKLTKQPGPVPRILGPASLLAAADGTSETIWIASQYGVHQLAGGRWQQARADSHEHLARDTSGIVWTVHQRHPQPDQLVGFHAGRWLEVAIEGEGVARLAPGQGGRLYAVVWGKGWKGGRVDVLTTTNGVAKWTARKLGNIDGVTHAAVDGNERIWIGHERGLLVVDKDGKRLAEWAFGTLPGLDGRVVALGFAHAGPATLPAATALAKGTVAGRIVRHDNTPFANQRFEICVGNCEGRAPSFAVQTDADGKFRVDDVPALAYDSAKIGSTIHSLGNLTLAGTNPRKAAIPFTCCRKLAAGKTLDVGALVAP